MKIAVTAQEKNLDSQVSVEFENSPYLLIVDMDDLSFTAISNGQQEGDVFTENVLSFDCEAVITGRFLNPDIFYKIADACITRFKGDGHTVRDALTLMEDHNQLDLIRDFRGDGCAADHHDDGSCSGDPNDCTSCEDPSCSH